MNLLVSSSPDPYFNLATEEFLLKHSHEDFLFLYFNSPCVVIGKHQIAPKEINSSYIYNNKILIARRLTGGGAVYHDEENLNFSFIQANKKFESLNYQLITLPIFNYLRNIGLNVVLSQRNDFQIAGKKISGSAMHLYKNRFIAHGTILIDCNLSNLSNALNGNQDRYSDKSIRSVRSQVLNLSELDKNYNRAKLSSDLTNYLKTNYETSSYSLTENEMVSILDLSNKKYSRPEWIYGYSPRYTYSTHFQYEQKAVSFILEVEKGLINDVVIESVNELSNDILLKLNQLRHIHHNFPTLVKLVESEKRTNFDLLLLNALF